MKPYYSEDGIEIYLGDCRELLPKMEEGSVSCVVTSPPYWGLRDYGLEPVVWGGRADCEHRWGDELKGHNPGRSDHGTGDPTSKLGPQQDGLPGGTDQGRGAVSQGNFCQYQDCQAWRGCLGLEPTPELYVSHLVEIFRAVRRVLRDDGTLWLNLGDSYASHDPGGYRPGEFLNPGGRQPVKGNGARNRAGNYKPKGLKPKDLIGIPWRVAFALQADGWWLRSDIIWSKPNPMPESVTDRPTKAHEYVFLLSKTERYFWNQDAVRELVSDDPVSAARRERKDYGAVGALGLRDEKHGQSGKGLNRKSEPLQGSHGTMGHDGNGMRMPEKWNDPAGRNIRSVWTIPTQPYPEAHFATYPEELVKRCVLAGCPEGGVVLDPFSGSGTTLKVARDLGCQGWGIEASAEYVAMSQKRLSQKVLKFS